MAVLQSENKRLRDKFNQITKETKLEIMVKQGTIDENLKQIDKLNENLEESEIQKTRLEKEKNEITASQEEKLN